MKASYDPDKEMTDERGRGEAQEYKYVSPLHERRMDGIIINKNRTS